MGLLLAGLLFTCPAFGADDGTIKVGILHSLSGTMAISESALKDTVLMLIADQNRRGGLLGRKLEPVVVDPASDWNRFADEARVAMSLSDDVVAVTVVYTDEADDPDDVPDVDFRADVNLGELGEVKRRLYVHSLVAALLALGAGIVIARVKAKMRTGPEMNMRADFPAHCFFLPEEQHDNARKMFLFRSEQRCGKHRSMLTKH